MCRRFALLLIMLAAWLAGPAAGGASAAARHPALPADLQALLAHAAQLRIPYVIVQSSNTVNGESGFSSTIATTEARLSPPELAASSGVGSQAIHERLVGGAVYLEIPGLAAVAHGLDAAILYRRPNIASADRIIQEMRQVKMGTLIAAGRDAPLRLAEALQSGQHVAILVDQYLTGGVEVTFFGRKTRANPMLARLLRQVECPIHGVRIIRLPNNRFRAELSEEVKPVRDAAGAIDIQGTMQAVTSVVEGWVREYPDQWLWLHRRWR